MPWILQSVVSLHRSRGVPPAHLEEPTFQVGRCVVMRRVAWLMASLVVLSACDAVTSPSTSLPPVPDVAETMTSAPGPSSTRTTSETTAAPGALGEVDLVAAEPYSGEGCSRDQVLLSDPVGTVWVLDVDSLAAYRLGHFKKDGDIPVQAFGYETFLVAGDAGLVMVSGGERSVLVDPPVGEDVAFVPYVRVLDTYCHDDGNLFVLLAGEFDSWFVDSYGLAQVNAAGLVGYQPLDLSFEPDFAEFGPTGKYATLALFGPDPAFGGLWGVLDVASGAEVVMPEGVPMVPIGGEPTLFVGPMLWTGDVTVRQHWKVGDADIEAADINVGDGTFVSVEPDSVRGWSGECPIRVFGGFVRDEVRGPLALIDETVVSYCW